MRVNKYYTYTYTLNKMEFVLVNLNTLTRKQLQTYAKQNGVKANGKTIMMLEQLQTLAVFISQRRLRRLSLPPIQQRM